MRDSQIVRRQQPDVFPVPARQLKGNHDVGNQQGVLKEQSADAAFLLPIQLVELQGQFPFQPGCALVAQTVGDPARAALVVVNLASWPFQVTVMKKPLQPPQHLLPAAGA